MRLDGVPTEGHTGAMLHPYEGSTETGMLTVPQPLLDRIVTEFDRQGLHIKFHAAGDAAVRAAIEAVAAAREANGFGGPMHDVAHNSFVDPADIDRVRELNMSWEFSPYIWYPTPIAYGDVRRAVGDERMKRWIPIRDAVESGALVAAGSDWSVVPSINPWLAIETMVTRRMPGGGEETLGEDQRITLEQALHIFTEGGAREMGHRDIVGSIEPGMRADLVVTRTNPFKVPITQVHRIEVDLTFIDGEQVYDAANPPNLTAH
jgi:predicted amidohydrolase YtcJ